MLNQRQLVRIRSDVQEGKTDTYAQHLETLLNEIEGPDYQPVPEDRLWRSLNEQWYALVEGQWVVAKAPKALIDALVKALRKAFKP